MIKKRDERVDRLSRVNVTRFKHFHLVSSVMLHFFVYKWRSGVFDLTDSSSSFVPFHHPSYPSYP